MSTDKRYYTVQSGPRMHLVIDRHHPNNVVAYCPDDMKAWMIMVLLNDGWDKARKRSE